MNRLFLFILSGVLAVLCVACEDKNLSLKIGDLAPDFKLKDENGTFRSLNEFQGKKIALYFYPKDDTPGCTKQACSLRDAYDDLQKANIIILGISYDSPESHRTFKEKYDLPFPLLSDEEKTVAKKYGSSWGILGNLIIKRQTYLLDEEGKILEIMKNVDVSKHAQEIIQAFEKVAQNSGSESP